MELELFRTKTCVLPSLRLFEIRRGTFCIIFALHFLTWLSFLWLQEIFSLWDPWVVPLGLSSQIWCPLSEWMALGKPLGLSFLTCAAGIGFLPDPVGWWVAEADPPGKARHRQRRPQRSLTDRCPGLILPHFTTDAPVRSFSAGTN